MAIELASKTHKSQPLACGALSNDTARRLVTHLLAAKAKLFIEGRNLQGITFKCRWSHRRYVWGDGPAVFDPVPHAIRNHDADTVTIPISPSPESYVNELRGFGMAAASRYRAQTKGLFDLVDDEHGEVHRVPQYHHVAVCGYKGPWPDNVLDAGSANVSCSGCVKASKRATASKKPVPRPPKSSSRRVSV